MKGMFATSKAGHDKGKLYIIMEEEDEYVYLSDGRLRTVDKLKKKKKKHIQIIKKIDERIFLEIENHRQISNEEIKRAIKEYEHRPIQEGENVKSRCYVNRRYSSRGAAEYHVSGGAGKWIQGTRPYQW